MARDIPSHFDFVIVGAGTAGCLLANRLSADPRVRVLLIEAGGSDRHPFARMPAGFVKTVGNPRFDWRFTTEPEADLGGRRVAFPRGRVVGGSSVINGALHVRGLPSDFDGWAQSGLTGWSFDKVLPAFRSIERRICGEAEFDGAWRGRDGGLAVSDGALPTRLLEAFIAAAETQGLPRNPDYNGSIQHGIGYAQVTRDGRLRASSSQAFLRPARRRRNLHLLTDATVSRVLLEGARVTGVELLRKGRIE